MNSQPEERVCGRRYPGPQLGRIQGGQAANRTAWPWQAGLRRRLGPATAHHCGAVLLNHHWLATAAHCVFKQNRSKLAVVLGDHNNTEADMEPGQVDDVPCCFTTVRSRWSGVWPRWWCTRSTSTTPTTTTWRC